MATPKGRTFKTPVRNPLQEGEQATQLMRQAYPGLYATQAEWNPQFAALEAQTGAARSAAETAAVRASGTSVRDAIRGASPEIAATGDALLSQLGQLGPSAIEGELTSQALADLRLGGALSPDEMREIVQGGRAADSARGLANGSASAAREVMNRAGAVSARRLQRQQAAAGVDALSQQRKAGDRSYVLNAGQQAMQFYDPYARIFGNGGSAVSGQVSGPAAGQPYLASAASTAAGNQSALLTTLGMKEDSRQFDINRIDTAKYTEMNRNDTNANAAAQRSASNKNAAVSAGAGIAAAAMLAFLI